MFNEIERGAKEAITRLVSQLRKQKRGLRCKGVLFCGTAAMAIVDAAAKQSADVVVIGTHGHGGLVHLFLGSVAERVIRNSSRPVLTVHGGGAAAKASRKA
jgi:nucleotide-binding universal stress UspA family protein